MRWQAVLMILCGVGGAVGLVRGARQGLQSKDVVGTLIAFGLFVLLTVGGLTL